MMECTYNSGFREEVRETMGDEVAEDSESKFTGLMKE
jgi:hypothetical protein